VPETSESGPRDVAGSLHDDHPEYRFRDGAAVVEMSYRQCDPSSRPAPVSTRARVPEGPRAAGAAGLRESGFSAPTDGAGRRAAPPRPSPGNEARFVASQADAIHRRRELRPPAEMPTGESRAARSNSGVGRFVRQARVAWREGGRLRPPSYYALLSTIVVLNLVGLVMVLSSSSVEALARYGSSWLFFKRQLAWAVLGLVGLAVSSRVDYRILRRYVGLLLVVSSALLVLVLVPGVGIAVSGSSRWLGVGAARFQPSELAKLALLVYCADVVTRRAASVGDWRLVLRPVGLIFCFLGGLVMLQPDMGTTIVMGLITGAVLFVGGLRLRHLAAVLGTAIGAGALLAIVEPYRRARLLSFVDPFADAQSGGYQVAQSLIALGSGHWTGVGLGAGRAKWMFLPNAHTDFIFAIIGEELGLVGCVLVLFLFGALAVLGVRTAIRAPDPFGSLLAAGVTGWIVGQAIVNIGAVTGMLPVTGVPLPFVSFGGSALLFTMFATGVLLNVARQAT
jgi:cell division protein FtsW